MLRPLPSLLALAALASAPGLASALTIDFETAGFGLLRNLDYKPAPDITFAGTGLATIDADSPEGFPGSGDFGRAPTPIGAMTLYRPVGSMEGAIINVGSGFTGTLSFAFSTIFSTKASVQIYSEEGGRGTLLAATLDDQLPALGSDQPPFQGAFGDNESGSFNRWATFSLSFTGVAKSIVFNGESLLPNNGFSNGAVYFDDITLTPVPEPATYLLMFAGLAAIGAGVRRKQRD